MDSSEYERGLENAVENAETFGDKLKKGLSTAAKVGAAALAAAGTAIVSVTKQAVESYAEYEQLVGGVETLFKESADIVQRFAANAYETAGMSANEYMQTVTSFSAALINSLGGDTQKAAQLSNMAITDMADNANKMGVSLEALQNAYTGFSRGNFTMLDNLALGFSGTKEGMQQLLDKAEELSGVKYDISSYADIVEAIHVVQTEMGITGTTAEEAASTIQGSVAMMKSAWQNMLVGIADDNADFGTLIDNLVESVSAAANNILPRVEIALGGVANLISNLAPVIADKLPSMLQAVLPALVSGATSLVTALAGALPDILGIIVEQLPIVIEGVMTVIPMLIEALANSAPTLIDAVVNVLIILVQSLIDNAPMIIEAAIELILQLVQGLLGAIPTLVDALPQIIESIVSTLIQLAPELIAAALQIIIQLAGGLIQAIPELIAAIPEIISAIVGGLLDGLGEIVEVGRNIVEGIWDGISGAADWLWDKITGWLGGVVDGIKGFLGIASPSKLMRDIVGKNMALGIGVGFEEEMPNVEARMNDALQLNLKASTNITGEGRGDIVDVLREEIRALRDAVLSMQVVLNGAIVGEITDGVNENLGEVYTGTMRRSLA